MPKMLSVRKKTFSRLVIEGGGEIGVGVMSFEEWLHIQGDAFKWVHHEQGSLNAVKEAYKVCFKGGEDKGWMGRLAKLADELKTGEFTRGGMRQYDHASFAAEAQHREYSSNQSNGGGGMQYARCEALLYLLRHPERPTGSTYFNYFLNRIFEQRIGKRIGSSAIRGRSALTLRVHFRQRSALENPGICLRCAHANCESSASTSLPPAAATQSPTARLR